MPDTPDAPKTPDVDQEHAPDKSEALQAKIDAMEAEIGSLRGAAKEWAEEKLRRAEAAKAAEGPSDKPKRRKWETQDEVEADIVRVAREEAQAVLKELREKDIAELSRSQREAIARSAIDAFAASHDDFEELTPAIEKMAKDKDYQGVSLEALYRLAKLDRSEAAAEAAEDKASKKGARGEAPSRGGTKGSDGKKEYTSFAEAEADSRKELGL